jgi:hypothetical protein
VRAGGSEALGELLAAYQDFPRFRGSTEQEWIAWIRPIRDLRELEWKAIAALTGRSPDAARILWTRAFVRVGKILKERMP